MLTRKQLNFGILAKKMRTNQSTCLRIRCKIWMFKLGYFDFIITYSVKNNAACKLETSPSRFVTSSSHGNNWNGGKYEQAPKKVL